MGIDNMSYNWNERGVKKSNRVKKSLGVEEEMVVKELKSSSSIVYLIWCFIGEINAAFGSISIECLSKNNKICKQKFLME